MFEEKTYKRCACRGPMVHKSGPNKGKPVLLPDGTQKIGYLETSCPQLKKRTHGSWTYAIELPAKPGEKRQRAKEGGFATQKEAADKCAEVWAQAQVGVDVLSKETFGEYMDRWIDGKSDLARSTVDPYTRHIRLYIKPSMGHVLRKDIRKHHLDAMFGWINDENEQRAVHRALVEALAEDCEAKRRAWHAAPKHERAEVRQVWHEARDQLKTERRQLKRITDIPTQHKIKATLSSAMNDAVAALEMTRNWAALVTLPSIKPPRPIVWTPQRVARWRETGEVPSPVMIWTPQLAGQFLDRYVDDALFDLWHFKAFRGPRRGECCALPWSEVDLDNLSVTISQQVVSVAYKVYGEDPKADSERTISIDQENAALFRLRKLRQAADKARCLAAGKAWIDSGLVFTKEDGEGYHPDYLTARFKRLVEKADLPPTRLHDLRHLAASLARLAGVDMKGIQVQLGHSSFQITADTYTSVLPQLEQAAAEATLATVPRTTRITEAAGNELVAA
ncbi:tyrosine-type recombinase/integrase [Kitasatospora atroaurantiaca]|uniref:Phage integrase family protein n=1 Tax=Kitasatospora atroaurantiaca TaxID=285545 RepID=A0A561EN55_9ACTN|nr:site-specific integrase [Kitasatospora atroaurantiaca]TWE17012.1 phage integrase family protein [Kitasatospora atroaurantiaca]